MTRGKKTIPVADAMSLHGTCGNCAWWEGNEENSAGYCHRFPPSWVVEDDAACTMFPITDTGEFCGEHRGRQ